MTSVRAARGKMTDNNPHGYLGLFCDETVKNPVSMISQPLYGTL
jgi:hypothetical protein